MDDRGTDGVEGDGLDDLLAAARPDPAPATEVVAGHRAQLDRAMAEAPAGDRTAGPADAAPIVVAVDGTRSARRGASRRWARPVAGAAAAVALAVTGVAVLQRDTATETTVVADDPTTTASTTTASTTTPLPPFTCGAELPLALDLPPGFGAPLDGPSPHAATAAAGGQLVRHWTSPSGTIELRWPAAPTPLGTPSGRIARDGTDLDPSPALVISTAGPLPTPTGTVGFEALLHLVEEDGTEACSQAVLTIVEPSEAAARATGSALVQAVSQAASDPVDLVVDTSVTASAPAVGPCQAPPAIDHVDHRSETVEGLGTFADPSAALRHLVDTSTILMTDGFDVEVTHHRFALGGYEALHLPDGTVAFTWTAPGNDPADGVNALIVAEPVDGGWTITRWTTSGC